MELAESLITQFKLHLQIHGSKITHRQHAIIVQRDKFSYMHTSCIILVKCAQVQFLFSVDFGAHVYFQLTIHRSQNLVDFLPLSMPFCTFGARSHGTGKNLGNAAKSTGRVLSRSEASKPPSRQLEFD